MIITSKGKLWYFTKSACRTWAGLRCVLEEMCIKVIFLGKVVIMHSTML